ncbi:hypothetical protein [Hymenobacter guriensis]|uniref:Uncharacterized protein n=1 Tax=Hymenobacter guriensis TaxID=2793065 RepID=A0ABS0L5A3_9BACT|nr:hypothetical protein [Hymenobacter guriensis]MBG8555105.1 hypothetical protein [Hymenobacter guriensis]
MKRQLNDLTLHAQITALFAEGETGVWHPHTTVEELINEQLAYNRCQEAPDEEIAVLERLVTWMGEQLHLVQHLAEQSSPEAQAAYAEQIGCLYDQELSAMLATAEACGGDYRLPW